MTHRIHAIKEKITEHLEDQLKRGISTARVEETGKMVDMIKDLADTEKLCWEACYYKSVVEAMDQAGESSHGYSGSGGSDSGSSVYSGSSGYSSRMGYSGSTGSSASSRMGYEESPLGEIKHKMAYMPHDKRIQMKEELEQMLKEM